MPDFTQFSLVLNLGLFTAGAVAVWIAGVRLTHDAEAISRKTGIGHATLGLLLLAGVTSLPEIAVTVAAAAVDHIDLAINNLFGSIAMLVAVIAVIDLLISRRAMTAVVPEPSLLLLGTLNVLLLAIAAAGIVVGDVAVFGAGAWAWACLAAYVGSLWVLSQAEGRQPWLPADGDGGAAARQSANEASPSNGAQQGKASRLAIRTVAASAVILIAGVVVEQTGSAIADQTGIGSSFIGFVLVAVSTSLPEFSSALAAARLGFFTMALSDILGSNLINVALIVVADVVAAGEPVLDRVGSFATFGAILAIALNAVYIAGVAERRDIAVLRMGIDSIVVLALYAGGLVLLYQMR